MIDFKGVSLASYEIVTDGKETSCTAAEILAAYIKKLCGECMPAAAKFSLKTDESVDDEYFRIQNEGKNLLVTGGKRGIIYGVYDFLEKFCGCRFFAYDDEYLPTENRSISEDIFVEECSVVKFREILGNSSGNNAESFLKFRLNSNAWSEKLKPAHGGGYSYAGIPAHTLTGEFLLKDYMETKPELFSLVDGTRRKDRFGQICFSNEEVVPIVTKEVLKLLDKKPDASFVSVSQGDNDNYCQCPKCQELYKTHSRIDLYVDIINAIAREVKKKYPKVLVHTFAYNETAEGASEDIFFEDNVILQYCIGSCRNHAFTDEGCEVNVAAKRVFDLLAKRAKNILIWDYPNCFKHQLINLPAVKYMRQNTAYLASHHVTGIFNEYVHNAEYGACQFAEMKTYLLSKLMWNPYMSEEEYLRHYEEFMAHYYGAGYRYLMEYIALWEESLDPSLHFTYEFHKKEVGKRDVFMLGDPFIPVEKQAAFMEKAEELWEKAAVGVTEAQADRIRREKVQYLYLKQILTFDKAMERGSETEKAAALAANRCLIDEIIHYNLRLTYWGYTIADQNEDLPKNYAHLSPVHWDYSW